MKKITFTGENTKAIEAFSGARLYCLFKHNETSISVTFVWRVSPDSREDKIELQLGESLYKDKNGNIFKLIKPIIA